MYLVTLCSSSLSSSSISSLNRCELFVAVICVVEVYVDEVLIAVICVVEVYVDEVFVAVVFDIFDHIGVVFGSFFATL